MRPSFPGASDGKESACNAGDPGVIPGSEDPLKKRLATHPSILAGEFHGQRSLAGYSPRGCKESGMTEQLHFPNTFMGLCSLGTHFQLPALQKNYSEVVLCALLESLFYFPSLPIYFLSYAWFLAAAAAAKSLQSCPTLGDPIDGSPPGSPTPGILQARTLEWVATAFSVSSWHHLPNRL